VLEALSNASGKAHQTRDGYVDIFTCPEINFVNSAGSSFEISNTRSSNMTR
jgi:hypothetical protein